jgi:mannitol/fructose-specific phosphotransferase system IIA component (Ntr-type)
MINLFDYFKEELIFLDFESDNQINFFGKIFKILEERGDVKYSFLTSIIEREKEFPTGLNFGKYNIAIPHTSPEHINNEAVVFVRNKNKIVFRDMGMDLDDLETDFIFLLLVKKNGEQIEVLEKLMELLLLEEVLDKLKIIKSKEEAYNLLKEKLNKRR